MLMFPSVAKQFQKDKFDAQYKEWDERFVYLPFWIAFERETLAKWIRKIGEKYAVLDVGCGTGRSMIPLARRARRVVGLDVSKHMLMMAKRKMESKYFFNKVDFVIGDAEIIPFIDGCFNAVACCGLLSCLPRPYIALNEISRILKNNCLFFAFELNGARFGNCLELYASLIPIKPLFLKAKKNRQKNSEKVSLDIPCKLLVEDVKEFLIKKGFEVDISAKVLIFLPNRFQSIFHRNYALSKLWLFFDNILEKIPNLRNRGKYLVLTAQKIAS